jgi:hypothetical protein
MLAASRASAAVTIIIAFDKHIVKEALIAASWLSMRPRSKSTVVMVLFILAPSDATLALLTATPAVATTSEAPWASRLRA